jgi:cardiolipin synthase
MSFPASERSRQLVLTLPNQLTLLRMGLVPVFIIFLVSDMHAWALATFLFASFTDALDGFIARVWRQKTTLGAYLDPVADKALLMTGIVSLAFLQSAPNFLPLWAAIIFVARDVILLICVSVIMLSTSYRDFRPAVLGKATTFTQLFLIIYALVFNWLGRPAPHFEAAIWLVIGATTLSTIQYALRITKIFAEQETNSAAR